MASPLLIPHYNFPSQQKQVREHISSCHSVTHAHLHAIKALVQVMSTL